MARGMAQNRRQERGRQNRGGAGFADARGRASRAVRNTPHRFMEPRVVLVVVTAILVLFGLLMIWSASSVTDLASSTYGNDPTYHVKNQLIFAALGVVLAVAASRFDYHAWTKTLIKPLWIATMIALVMVFLPGFSQDAYGANRWINIGGFSFQPSEFAKILIVIVAAEVAQRYFEEQTFSDHEFLKYMAIGVAIPMAAILFQPDKGTTMILAATLLVMAFLAGFDRKFLVAAIVVAAVGILFLALKDDYSRRRIITMFDPFQDAEGSGYQLIQGFYAFGSGGIFGVGIGFSKQKYAYLPMAHNDFIFAIIGEELGLVGTLGLLAAFAVLGWAGLKIAEHAPDLSGRLIASGCTAMLIIQLFVNINGVLGIMPMTGKPIPFISYGGSSIIASLLMVGVILSVSKSTVLPETDNDRARKTWRVSEGMGDPGLSYVGEPTPRSSRGNGAGAGSAGGGFRVVDGGAGAPRQRREDRGGSGRNGSASGRGADTRRTGRSTPIGQTGRDASGRSRIDLGPSATDRLRGRDQGPRVRR